MRTTSDGSRQGADSAAAIGGVVVLIAVLGLFALSAVSTHLRTYGRRAFVFPFLAVEDSCDTCHVVEGGNRITRSLPSSGTELSPVPRAGRLLGLLAQDRPTRVARRGDLPASSMRAHVINAGARPVWQEGIQPISVETAGSWLPARDAHRAIVCGRRHSK